jgi:hypothetical protein
VGKEDLAAKEGAGNAIDFADDQTTICSICQCDFEVQKFTLVTRLQISFLLKYPVHNIIFAGW